MLTRYTPSLITADNIGNEVRRPSNSTHRIIGAMSRGMQYYTAQNAMRKPLKHLIQCYKNSSNRPTNRFAVSYFLDITQERSMLIDVNDRASFPV